MTAPMSFNPYRPAQVAFVLHDAGETNALRPVMRALDSAGVDYGVLADATAKSLLAGDPHVVASQEEIAALSRTNPQGAAMAQARLQSVLNAPTAVVGLVSPFQKAWADFFKQAGRQVVGYYDSFNVDTLRSRADAFIGSLTALVTPSLDTARFFQRRFQNIPVLALGHPGVEETPPANPVALAQALQLNPGQPTLLFVGGYGPGYAEALQLFCQTALQCPNVNIVVSPHPKVDGSVERQVLSALDPAGRVRILPKTIPTDAVFGLSHIVASQDSSLSMKALLQGKSVLLVGNPVTTGEATNFNPITHYNVASRARTPQELQSVLRQSLQTVASRVSAPQTAAQTDGLFALFGIPKLAAEKIASYLMALSAPSAAPPFGQAVSPVPASYEMSGIR